MCSSLTTKLLKSWTKGNYNFLSNFLLQRASIEASWILFMEETCVQSLNLPLGVRSNACLMTCQKRCASKTKMGCRD